jgi:hypothetical protein
MYNTYSSYTTYTIYIASRCESGLSNDNKQSPSPPPCYYIQTTVGVVAK